MLYPEVIETGPARVDVHQHIWSTPQLDALARTGAYRIGAAGELEREPLGGVGYIRGGTGYTHLNLGEVEDMAPLRLRRARRGPIPHRSARSPTCGRSTRSAGPLARREPFDQSFWAAT